MSAVGERPTYAELAEAERINREFDKRAAYVAGLRQLADALDAHPEIPLPWYGAESRSPVIIGFHGADEDVRKRMAAAVRAMPSCWSKDPDEKWLNLNGQLAGLHVQLYASRDAVCTRRVVGTEEREVEEEVRPAETRKVRKQVDVVEWDCGPILNGGKTHG